MVVSFKMKGKHTYSANMVKRNDLEWLITVIKVYLVAQILALVLWRPKLFDCNNGSYG